MSGFDSVLAQAARHSGRHGQAQDGDYIGPDGLLYCGKCHTPKQFRGNFLGQERVVGSLCRCAAEKRDALLRRIDEGDRQARMGRMRRGAIQSSLLRGANFAAARPTELIAKARNYVAHWELARENNTGLLLIGGLGVGKSYAAACICNALLDQGVPCRMVSFGSILSMGFEERGDFLSRVDAYGLLVLDDLGAERSTEFADETVFSVVDQRYRSRKPMIVTTNLPLSHLKDPGSLSKSRIYDRLLEVCGPVLCDGENQRLQSGRDKRQVLREVLRGG